MSYAPQEEEINQQLELLRLGLKGHPKLFELLWYLTKEADYAGGVIGKNVTSDFFYKWYFRKYPKREIQKYPVEKAAGAGRGLARLLSGKLSDYYAKLLPGAPDRLLITIPLRDKGGNAYQPLYEPIGEESDAKLRKEVEALTPTPDLDVKFIPVPTHVAPAESDPLGDFRRLYHRYHLTLDADGRPVWICAEIDFSKKTRPDLLVDEDVVLLPSAEANKDVYRYRFVGEMHGNHLLLKMALKSKDTTIRRVAVELFRSPHTGQKKTSQLYGARINDTFQEKSSTVVTSRVILSVEPIVEAELGPIPVTDPRARTLTDLWESHSGIERLPSEGLYQKWNNRELKKFIEDTIAAFRLSDEEKTVNILTSSFINEEHTNNYILNPLLKEGFQINVRMLHYNNPALVFARFGARGKEEKFRYPKVLDEIKDQWERFAARKGVQLLPTDLMPYGFAIFSNYGGVIGLLPAHDSYRSAGPLIRVDRGTHLFKMMIDDWRAREQQPPLESILNGQFLQESENLKRLFQNELEERLKHDDCRKIRIWISWLPPLIEPREDVEVTIAALDAALQRNACIEVLYSHPSSAFVACRGEAVLGDASKGKEKVIAMRSNLMKLKPRTPRTLCVRFTDEPIPIPFIQIDDRVYLGMFWSSTNAADGPWITLNSNESKFRRDLVKQFEKAWTVARNDDLSKKEPPSL